MTESPIMSVRAIEQMNWFEMAVTTIALMLVIYVVLLFMLAGASIGVQALVRSPPSCT